MSDATQCRLFRSHGMCLAVIANYELSRSQCWNASGNSLVDAQCTMQFVVLSVLMASVPLIE